MLLKHRTHRAMAFYAAERLGLIARPPGRYACLNAAELPDELRQALDGGNATGTTIV